MPVRKSEAFWEGTLKGGSGLPASLLGDNGYPAERIHTTAAVHLGAGITLHARPSS
jgi:hypothetical protein